jgi:NAD(P)-dependent dehydrogenase (short-subunit alcohol dehydrogenase family)
MLARRRDIGSIARTRSTNNPVQEELAMAAKTDDWLGLKGKVAVVTGAGSGIGKACATGLAEVGASVALLDLDAKSAAAVAAEIKAAGGKALAVECDTSNPASVKAAAAKVAKELGDPDVLVNNAGILRSGPLADLDVEAWNRVLAINLTGYFLCAQAFGAPMRKRRKGAMVHIASIAGIQPQPWSGAYSPSKAGVVMLSRQIALEWGPDGVRSNAVCPGTIRTPLSEAFYQVPGVMQAREKVIPVGRIGYPKDIADATVYLVSERAAFVTGEDVLVDGGLDKTIMGLLPRPGHEAPKS